MTAIRSPENASFICLRIAEGWTLRQLAQHLGCSSSAITQWYATDPVFAEQYARAKEAQAEFMADEVLEIADDGRNDWIEREVVAGRMVTVPDNEAIQRSRLRVEARKWLMGKMAPKRYGDNSTHDINVKLSWEKLIEQVAAKRLAPPTIEHDSGDDHAEE